MFVFKRNDSKHEKMSFISTLLSTFVSLTCFIGFIFLFTLSGDVELNPGPKRKATQALPICH